MMKTKSDESPFVPPRLLLDEIVEDLSRNVPNRGALRDAIRQELIDDGCATQEKQNGDDRRLPARLTGSWGHHEEKERVGRCWTCAQVTMSTLPSIFWPK